MAAATQVIDLEVNPLDARRRRRRAWIRIGVPILGVGLMIVAILGIALYADRANRSGVLALSEDVIENLEARVIAEVNAYLSPAERAVGIAGEMIELAARNPTNVLRRYSTALLRELPQITLLSLADPDGNYLMIRRGADGKGGIDIQQIKNKPEPREPSWIYYDKAGVEIRREADPENKYDPRTRSWYEGATKTDGLFWTGAYVFYAGRQAGITVASRHRAANGVDYVIGIDLSLASLSRFLGELEIGKTGRAVIVDGAGQLIAAPTAEAIVREVDGQLISTHVEQFGDAVLTRAWDRFRVEGPGQRNIVLDGRTFITTATRLATGGRDWLLLMVVPESDFVGFVATNNRNALAMSLVIVGIAALLGVLLVHQGLRADRSARALLEREQAILRQSAAFAELAADADLFDPARAAPPLRLTENLASIAGARRASVWRLVEQRILRCEDSFDRDRDGHVSGMELHRGELPHFFGQILSGAPLEVADAGRDRRTVELHRVLMSPLGSRALLAVPVRRGDQVVGAVWLEDAPSDPATRDFVQAVANMIALRMASVAALPAAPGGRAASTGNVAAEASGTPAMRSFDALLSARHIDTAGLHAEVYSDLAVMVMQFTDAEAMAARSAGAERALSDEIAIALQAIAREHDVPYLKIVGHEVIAATGFTARGSGAALVIADMAVAMRDRCIALYEESDRPQDVRIGIDCGLAIGCSVGAEPRIFNLWGDAVRAAQAMASSALPGSVQITQAAYGRLSQDYLFRPRGRFYMPQVGESQTFVLAGRL